MAVLILTCPEDITADMVVHRLAAMDAHIVRLDPEDFPARMELDTVYADGTVRGRITHGRRTVDLADIAAVWVRRPGRPGEGAREQPAWVARECDHALYGALRALPARWMTHPDIAAAARYKVTQLGVAHAVGLRVPHTVVTTVPQSAAAFAGRWPEVVCKTVSGSQPDGLALPTTVVPPDSDFAGVAGAPVCLQPRVSKRADIRLTVVGDAMFAARTESGVLDWRFGDQTQWAPVPVPAGIADRVRRFMAALSLPYGAIDLVETPGGEWVFLEVNVAGQFGFVELATGQPISQAIADWLTTPSPARTAPALAGAVH